MIVRMWEARVRPERLAEVRDWIASTVWPAMVARDGFLGAELLRSCPHDADRLLLMSRWRDEAAVAAFAGPHWWDTPRVAAGEEAFVLRPPQVWHFASA